MLCLLCAGVPFSFEADRSNMVICTTSGSLTAGVAWGVDDEGNVLVPVMSRQTGHQLGYLNPCHMKIFAVILFCILFFKRELEAHGLAILVDFPRFGANLTCEMLQRDEGTRRGGGNWRLGNF